MDQHKSNVYSVVFVAVTLLILVFIIGYYVERYNIEQEITKREAIKAVQENPEIPMDRLMLILKNGR